MMMNVQQLGAITADLLHQSGASPPDTASLVTL
jgi:hypothetical protein